jgi:putative aminopeptidase FrvX
MDEIGLIVKLITDEGFIKFSPLGGWWGHVMLAQRVVIKTRKGDVIGYIVFAILFFHNLFSAKRQGSAGYSRQTERLSQTDESEVRQPRELTEGGSLVTEKSVDSRLPMRTSRPSGISTGG